MFIWVYTYVGCHSLNELYKGKEKDCSPHYFTDVLTQIKSNYAIFAWWT